ncbi:hypothetical protein GWI33_009328, partial [Rhynchophorus ferrugineus]
MRRLPPNYPPQATEEDRKKAREGTVNNLIMFGVLVLLIRILPFAVRDGDVTDMTK